MVLNRYVYWEDEDFHRATREHIKATRGKVNGELNDFHLQAHREYIIFDEDPKLRNIKDDLLSPDSELLRLFTSYLEDPKFKNSVLNLLGEDTIDSELLIMEAKFNKFFIGIKEIKAIALNNFLEDEGADTNYKLRKYRDYLKNSSIIKKGKKGMWINLNYVDYGKVLSDKLKLDKGQYLYIDELEEALDLPDDILNIVILDMEYNKVLYEDTGRNRWRYLEPVKEDRSIPVDRPVEEPVDVSVGDEDDSRDNIANQLFSGNYKEVL